MHVDTGHNFPEVIAYRDKRVAELGVRLVVGSVQESIDAGRVVEEKGPKASRNRLQSVTLLDTIEQHEFDAVFGGGRRDEDKARAKERVYSFRDEFGQWDPKNQRPELWSLYNGRHRKGEHIRVFPISNWTELDVWQYIKYEEIELPSIYYAHQREVFQRDGMWLAVTPFVTVMEGEVVETPHRPLPHRRRRQLHRRRGVHGRQRRRRDHGGGRQPHHRAGRHPSGRQVRRGRHGRPQEGGLLLMEMLRFATAGSVDDGKSTLIGRLLLDSKQIFEDQLEAVERTSRDKGFDYTNLALLTDGLRAEREQGITIDVAYRYFATPKRKFIIADTPGHVQYTRNMVTGASTADLALVLVDARKGMTEQSRRHAVIASLLQVKHLAVCVNKMDLVDFDEKVFEEIRAEFTEFAGKLEFADLTFIPISALLGDNVIEHSANTPWYGGPDAAVAPGEPLHRLGPQPDRPPLPGAVRHPPDVQRPPRLPRLRRAGGRRPVPRRRRGAGAAVRASPPRWPSVDAVRRARSTRRSSPMSVTIRLDDEIDISRGDMICRPDNAPTVSQDIEAMVCWFSERPLSARSTYAIKHTTRSARAMVRDLHYRLDVNTPPPGRGVRPAGHERHRPRHAAHHRAALLRRVPPQPQHRQLHPHRRGDQRDGGRGHDPRRGLAASRDAPAGPDERRLAPERRLPRRAVGGQAPGRA